MTREEISTVIENNNSVALDTNQYELLRHNKLKSVLNIMWSHTDHKLLIGKTDAQELINNVGTFNLSENGILILNPSHEGHERVYNIEIDEDLQKIRLRELHDMSHYSLKIQIVDNQ
jgi:hypothetical protein